MSLAAEICRRYSIEAHLRSKGVEVVRIGRKLRCRCPLHKGGQERTPSFYITDRPDGGQWFKCFGCLPLSQEVLTVKGMSRADCLKEGDRVYDVYGNVVDVLKVLRHETYNPLVRVKTTIDNNGFVATCNHEMLWLPRPNKYGGSSGVVKNLRKADRLYPIELRHLLPGMWVPVPIPKDEGKEQELNILRDMRSERTRFVLPASKEFAWFCGLYAAEGSISGNRLISIDLHRREADVVRDRLDKVLNEKCGLGVNVVAQKPRGNGQTVTICHAGLARWLKLECGGKCDLKRMPMVIRTSPLQTQASWLCGFYYGDGTAASQTIGVTSKAAVQDAFRISLMCGAVPSLQGIRRCKGKLPVYGIHYKHGSLEDIIRIAEGEVFRPRCHKDACHVRLSDGNLILAVKVTDIKFRDYDKKTVIDIQTSGTHTYSCLSIGVHNCDVGGDVITLVAKMEGRSNGEAIGSLARKLGIEDGGSGFEDTTYSPPSHETVLSSLCEQEELAIDIASYLMVFMKSERGSKDSVNKASYVYRKLDEYIFTGNTDGMKGLLKDVKDSIREYEGPIFDLPESGK